MKILISSHAFDPSFGGIETVTRLLALEFNRKGHEVAVVTQSAGEGSIYPFPIVRRPTPSILNDWIGWSDILWHNNLSVRTLWPNLRWARPVVVTHTGSYYRKRHALDLCTAVKQWVGRAFHSVVISHSAREFDPNATVIPNPFDTRLFDADSKEERLRELVFVGRLVAEKGVDLLFRAVASLKESGLVPRLTVIGDGPERPRLNSISVELGIGDQIEFTGQLTGSNLAREIRKHRIMVVPSLYEEPFGVVALEGIASGCVVVGSTGGGLPEAIGRCGLLFLNGNCGQLTKAIRELLTNDFLCGELRAHAREHLAKFSPQIVAEAYLDLFHSAIA